jgi:glyoxylase-like metal-dependent hydrolase (beta-lactamase superfamily II)
VSLSIELLDLGDITLESSFLVLARDCGKVARVPTFGFLIKGGPFPVLVDTGYINPEIMQRLGMGAPQTPEQRLENQLARHGLKFGDIRYILHTHLHIDHAGRDHDFPDATTVVINRRELEYSVSGIMGAQYPAEYVKPLVDRLHTPGALRLLDLEISGGEEIMPGVVCVAAGGHTEGSMNVLVETAEGTACICGDVIYDIHDQCVAPLYQVNDLEPATTGNHGMTKRGEKGAIKKALNAGSFVLPVHDRPAKVVGGRIAGRLHDVVPGPVTELQVEPHADRLAFAA